MRYYSLATFHESKIFSAISTGVGRVERAETWKARPLRSWRSPGRIGNGAGHGRDLMTFHIVLGFEIAAAAGDIRSTFLFMGTNMFVSII
jgi:hypothetical protein